MFNPYFFTLKIYEGKSKMKIVSGLLIATLKTLDLDLTGKVYFFKLLNFSVLLIKFTSYRLRVFCEKFAFFAQVLIEKTQLLNQIL